MKINSDYPDNSAAGAQGSARAQEPGPAGAGRSGRGEQGGSRDDHVNLSTLASAVRGALSDSPERAARLSRLAADFEAGRGGGEAEAIARALVDDALLDGTTKPEAEK